MYRIASAARRLLAVWPALSTLSTLSSASMGVSAMAVREAQTAEPAVRYVVVAAPLSEVVVRAMLPSRGPSSQQPAVTTPGRAFTAYPPPNALASIEAASTTPYVTSLPPGPVAVITGGFSGADPSRPSGLVIADGELVRQLNLSKSIPRPAPANVDCPSVGKYKWSGLLCSTGKTIRIDNLSALEGSGFADVEKCRDAVQSFPLIVEPNGRNGICSDEPTRVSARGVPTRPEARALVCLTDREMKLIVTEPTHLYPLAQHLIAAEGCLTALNLSGSEQATIGYRLNPGERWTWWPSRNSPRPPVSSVIVISQRAGLEAQPRSAVLPAAKRMKP